MTENSEPVNPGQAIVSLLPCPFCGGPAESWSDRDDYGPTFEIYCEECVVQIEGSGSVELLAKTWNKRAATERETAFKNAIEHGGYDISPCKDCGTPIACIPDGLPMCRRCAEKLDNETSC